MGYTTEIPQFAIVTVTEKTHKTQNTEPIIPPGKFSIIELIGKGMCDSCISKYCTKLTLILFVNGLIPTMTTSEGSGQHLLSGLQFSELNPCFVGYSNDYFDVSDIKGIL